MIDINRLPKALRPRLRTRYGVSGFDWYQGTGAYARGQSWRGLLFYGDASHGVPTGAQVAGVPMETDPDTGIETRGVLGIYKPWWKDAGVPQLLRLGMFLWDDPGCVAWEEVEGQRSVRFAAASTQQQVLSFTVEQLATLRTEANYWFDLHLGNIAVSNGGQPQSDYTFEVWSPRLYAAPSFVGRTGAWNLHTATSRIEARVQGQVPISAGLPRSIGVGPCKGLGVLPFIG